MGSRGPLRDPLRGRFHSQRLSVLLPLFIWPSNFLRVVLCPFFPFASLVFFLLGNPFYFKVLSADFTLFLRVCMMRRFLDVTQKWSPKCWVMDSWSIASERCGGFWVATFFVKNPPQKGLNILHRCKQRNLSPRIHSGGVPHLIDVFEVFFVYFREKIKDCNPDCLLENRFQAFSPNRKQIIGETLTATRKDRYRILRSFLSTPGMAESAFYCANHKVSCKCQQPPGWKVHRYLRWKVPFAVFCSGFGVSEISSKWVPEWKCENKK